MEAALSTNPDRKGDPLYTHGKVGPKKKKPVEPRKAYAVRLSHAELVKLKERALAAGYANISEYIRHHHAATPQKVVQKPLPEVAQLVAEIRAIGININQITRHINEHARLGILREEQIERAIVAKEWLAMIFNRLTAKFNA